MKTVTKQATSEEVQNAMNAVKQTTYKLTLPIDKRLSHTFQSLCKELDTDASKQLRSYIERCVEGRELL